MNQFTQEQQKLKRETSSIFDEENIIEEKVLGMQLVDDVYRAHAVEDINKMIEDLVAMEMITQQLNNNTGNLEDSEVIIQKERTSKHTLEAAAGFVNMANNLYNLTVNGSKCAHCGKVVKFVPPNGYCSIDCAVKALAKRILSHTTGEYERKTPEVITKVKNILAYIDVALNLLEKLPDLVASLAKLPPEYKEYATMKINIIFLYLKKLINYLLLKKNELLIKLLKQIDDGTIDSHMMPMFAQIQSVLQVILALRQQLDAAFSVALKAIENASMMFYIGPQEYGFFMTAKSFMSICPFFKTNPNIYPPSQLGQPFWGSGHMTIPFDMSKCQFSMDIGGFSALQNVDQKKLMKIIRAVFRPINEVEYLMDPELFDIRLALSDQNVPAIQKMIRLMEMLVVIGGDFLPAYKNLSLINIWFVVAILTCWGPTTRSIFGDFIFHGPI